MELSQKDIRFLNFGYFLENSPAVDLCFDQNKELTKLSFDEALKQASKLWQSTFLKQYLKTKEMDQVIPLSGGIDSRALLFELLKFKEAKDIHTFTFGVPGSLDYEIGNSIAESLGTNHRTILCNTTILTLENAITFKNLIGSSCNLFLTPPLKEIIPYKSMNIWSGTVIDVFFGRHFHEREARDLNQLAENYINENILTKSFRHMIDKDSLIA